MKDANTIRATSHSVDDLEALLKITYALDPNVVAELGALSGLEENFARPLEEKMTQALNWLDSVVTWLAQPGEGTTRQSEADVRGARALSSAAFAAQRSIQKSVRSLSLAGCGWDEALDRCKLALDVLSSSLREVVATIEGIERNEQAANIRPTTEYPSEVINALAVEANLTPLSGCVEGVMESRRCGVAPTIRQRVPFGSPEQA